MRYSIDNIEIDRIDGDYSESDSYTITKGFGDSSEVLRLSENELKNLKRLIKLILEEID